MVYWVMEPREEHTTDIFLNQFNSQLHSEEWFFVYTDKCSSHPHQRSYFGGNRQRSLQKYTTYQNVENNWLWGTYPYPIDASTIQACVEGSRNIREGMGRYGKSQRTRTSGRKQRLLYMTDSCNHEILIIWLHKQDMNNDTHQLLSQCRWEKSHEEPPR